jgi:hypothetical protein
MAAWGMQAIAREVMMGGGNRKDVLRSRPWQCCGLKVSGAQTSPGPVRGHTNRSDPPRPAATRSLRASIVTFGREVDTELDVFLEQ